jgi:hypothetical protein
MLLAGFLYRAQATNLRRTCLPIFGQKRTPFGLEFPRDVLASDILDGVLGSN